LAIRFSSIRKKRGPRRVRPDTSVSTAPVDQEPSQSLSGVPLKQNEKDTTKELVVKRVRDPQDLRWSFPISQSYFLGDIDSVDCFGTWKLGPSSPFAPELTW
jgi:hypothetical protein